MQLANAATFTQAERDAYERVRDEIQQVLAIAGEREAIGIFKGKRAAILAVLAARGIEVSSEVRARIEACQDEAMLDRWIANAARASSAEEVFTA